MPISNKSNILNAIASAQRTLTAATEAAADDRLEDALRNLAVASRTVAKAIEAAAANVNA